MSRHPFATELHRIVIQLDGNQFKGTPKQNTKKYEAYMTALKKIADRHGAKVMAKECLLKPAEITRTKKEMLKKMKKGK